MEHVIFLSKKCDVCQKEDILTDISLFPPVPVAARSKAARLLRLWVRIPPGSRMFVCCGCCVLSDRGLCDGLITRPEGSYRIVVRRV
jgi:hypothetical protein